MPAKNKKQQRLAGMTLAWKRGKGKKPRGGGMESMSTKDLEDFASDDIDQIAEMLTDDPDVFMEKELTTKARKGLDTGQFAIPDERKYPIHDKSHARNALSRVSQYGTPEEKAKVRAAVKRKYPDIGSEEAEESTSSECSY